MAAHRLFAIALLLALLNAPLTFAADSPSPAPDSGSDDSPASPSLPPSVNSPPAPPPNSPAPAPAGIGGDADSPTPTPSPAPAPGSQVAADDESHENTSDGKDNGGGGMSGAQKAGVAIGVIAGVVVVGAGAFIYKRRQSNMQRAQFGYDARREIL